MDKWVQYVIAIIILLIFVAIFAVVILTKYRRLNFLKTATNNLKNKNTGGVMPEDLGDFILGCCQSN